MEHHSEANHQNYKFEEHTLNDDEKQKSGLVISTHLSYVKFAENDEGKWGRIISWTKPPCKDKEARKGEYVFGGKKRRCLSNDPWSKDSYF